MSEFKYNFRVEFYDVDSMNVVWHGHYVKFLEAARCAFLRDVGFEYMDFRDIGVVLPVIKMEFKFIKPLFFGDECEVRVGLSEHETTLKLNYEIYKDNTLIAKASTAQAYVDIDNKLTLFSVPEPFLKALRSRYEI